MGYADGERFHGSIDELHQGFEQLILECANALDEIGNHTRLMDGRYMIHAEWVDVEDMRCYLRVFSRLDPRTASSPPERQKLRADYFFSRETSLPYVSDQRYYFTTAKKSVEVCDDAGVGISNDDLADNLEYLATVLKSLHERPTRQEISEEFQQVTAQFLVDHDIVVRALIKRIDEPGRLEKNRLTVERVMRLMADKEPILNDCMKIARAAIEAERLRLRTTRLQLE